jgi:hypothetical protein
MNNLVSVDALQEFLFIVDVSAAFSRTPRGQVQVLTRSGTNQFHGNLFDFFRNDALDANDWFANLEDFQKPPLRHNNFGGVLGGPILKNGTFFFLSYEGLRLRLPQFSLVNVPSRAARAAAPPAIQQLPRCFSSRQTAQKTRHHVRAFLQPTQIPASEDATSIRLDHVVKGRLSLFGWYS